MLYGTRCIYIVIRARDGVGEQIARISGSFLPEPSLCSRDDSFLRVGFREGVVWFVQRGEDD
jgi:hypothetical protein